MSLQLPAILSPPTPCFPSPALTVSPLERSPKLPCPLRVGVRFWASLTLRKLANASGRIVFNIALFIDWQFLSGCLPPRLSTTQFPSTTDSQCSVRWGLPPHGWCALSGARRDRAPARPGSRRSEAFTRGHVGRAGAHPSYGGCQAWIVGVAIISFF